MTSSSSNHGTKYRRSRYERRLLMTLRCSCTFVVLLVLSMSVTTFGQSTLTASSWDGRTPPALTPGAPAGSYPLSGFENVNLFNGKASVAIPLMEIGARGEARYTM